MMVCSGFAIECHNLVIIEAHVQIYLHAEYGHIILPVLFSSVQPDTEEGPRDIQDELKSVCIVERVLV